MYIIIIIIIIMPMKSSFCITSGWGWGGGGWGQTKNKHETHLGRLLMESTKARGLAMCLGITNVKSSGKQTLPLK